MRKLNRRDVLKLSGGLGLILMGCHKPVARLIIPEMVSYKLEDLCDTEVDWKDITLNVYIEDSEVLFDYHKNKEELFSYVSDFFKENKINCEILYSKKMFNGFDRNEFGVEIFDSTEEVKDRYAQLLIGLRLLPEENPLILDRKGYAATRARVALINGGWEEFRGLIKTKEITIDEVERQFEEEYKGTTKKIYLLKENAANICHELLHCLGLFHPLNFIPPIVDEFSQDVPNIMSYRNPNFKKSHSIGYCLTPLQQKLIHSFIAGNNNYKAFLDSRSDLDTYIENLAYNNNLKQRH